MNQDHKSVGKDDIVKDRILWGVRVQANYDGRIRTEGPSKVIPRSGPYQHKLPSGATEWAFDVKVVSGFIIPASFNDWGILEPEQAELHLPFHHDRLFTTRKAAVKYMHFIAQHEMSEAERGHVLTMALAFGEDAFGESVPEHLYPDDYVNPFGFREVTPSMIAAYDAQEALEAAHG